MKYAVRQLAIKSLRFHEKVDEGRIKTLLHEIVRDKMLKKPVVVDRKTHVVLDGHHRCHVFLRLGISRISCFLVNYFDNDIIVTFRRRDIKNKLLKEIIVQKVANGRLFPHKTTKHRLLYRPIINKKLIIPTKRNLRIVQ